MGKLNLPWNGALAGRKLHTRSAEPPVAAVKRNPETASPVIRKQRPGHDAAIRLSWYLEKVRLVEPASLGKPRSRDERDDPHLAAALAAKAKAIVTYDHDMGRQGVNVSRAGRFS